MTHLPPIPDAASAPYPPHPAPIPEAQKLATAAAETAAARKAEAEAAAELRLKRAAQVGMGIGTALLVGAAAWGLRLYSRRKPAAASGRPAPRPADKARRGKQDRARVAAGQPYEVSYFARKHGLSVTEARAIIKEAGPSRTDANRLAQARKGGAAA